MPPIIDREKCVGCGTCAEICPMQLFLHFPKEDKVPQVKFPDECWHCNSCVLDCKEGAIRLRIPMNYMMLHVDCAQLNKK